MRAGELVLLDVRPADEYTAGHLADAVSMPAADLEERLSELSDDVEIAVHCRGRYCVVAAGATEQLREAGLEAFNVGALPRALAARGYPWVEESD